MSFHLPIETPRLILRKFQHQDMQKLLAYRNDPEIAKYQIWSLPYREESAQALYKYLETTTPGTVGQWYQIASELKTTGEIIGDCAFCILERDEKQAEIGFTLAREYQGQGYATEAGSYLIKSLFVNFDLHRICANCDPRNHNSVKLLKNLGMRQEAHLIKSFWLKGEWVDEMWFAILR